MQPKFPNHSAYVNGADDPTRTDDLLITSELLYQLSYVGPEALSGCVGGPWERGD